MRDHTDTISLIKPDDWHLHLRDGVYLEQTVSHSANSFARVMVMPNLTPPVATAKDVLAYHQRIQAHNPNGMGVYHSLYLKDDTTVETLIQAFELPMVVGVKLYPAGVTTHSQAGVNKVASLDSLFDWMASSGKVLQIHGESLDSDIFDRERDFIVQTLQPLLKRFPKLKIVLEHISTAYACEFVKQSSANVAATITVHHLLYDRNVLLANGLKPHYYCLPILKRQNDKHALQQAACSGNPKFFLGTDSAPHPVGAKCSACGCAGIFSAPYAIPLLVEWFESREQLDKLPLFTSKFGATFYGMPENKTKISLVRKPQIVPSELRFGDSTVVPLAAGQTLAWQLEHDH